MKGCDLERIWSHTIDGLADLTESELKSCEAACKEKNGEACVGEGLLLYAGTNLREDKSEARNLLYAQCKASLERWCKRGHQRALMHARGTGVFKSAQIALQFFEKACRGQYREACSELSFYQRYGAFQPQTQGEAEDLYLQAGHAGNMHACVELGYLYQGMAHPVTEAWAAVLFQKACDGGMIEGCYDLGAAYIDRSRRDPG